MLLKQSGEKGFSVRSAGAISDESLPEKSHDNKIGKLWHSEKPIRFGRFCRSKTLLIAGTKGEIPIWYIQLYWIPKSSIY